MRWGFDLRVLVTGGVGFIGSHVVEELVRGGYEVVVLDNLSNSDLRNIEGFLDEVVFFKGDVRDSDVVSKAVEGVDAVVHLAALIDAVESFDKPLLYHEVNVYGTHVLLKKCVDLGVSRFIYASTTAVYGEPVNVPTPEDEFLKPINPYGLTKALSEKLVKYYSRAYGLKTTIFRLFNVYGPKQWRSRYAGVITKFIERVSKGEPPIIFGDGEQVRDFIYVEDVAKVFIKSLEEGVDGLYNLGTGRGVKIKDLAELVIKAFGLKELKPIHAPPRPGDIIRSVADITKLKEVFNVKLTDLEEGIRKTIEDYKNHSRTNGR